MAFRSDYWDNLPVVVDIFACLYMNGPLDPDPGGLDGNWKAGVDYKFHTGHACVH